MDQRMLALGVALSLVGSAAVRGQTSLDETRSTLQQWVTTRQMTSRLQTDWRSEKEMIEQTAALFEKELVDLDEEQAKADTGTSQVSEERAKLETEKAELEAATAKVAEWVTKLEARTRSLAGAFPPPLASKLEPLMKRLPVDPATTRITPLERMQNLVGILNEVDKFNSAVMVESQLQERPSGEEIQVKTLYVGLGQAYFVDKTGSFAGVGTPTLTGWEWKEQTGLGDDILHAIEVHENTQQPAFVGLPMIVN